MASSHYMPLSQHPYSIRLLKLLPSDDSGSPLRCELFHQDLDGENSVPYEALSYTWGNANETVDILLSDCLFPVTINLGAALRALRLSDKPRTLWVDATCINQKDLEEQGKQVGIMWNIYQAADCVIVWLGLEEGDSSIAMYNFARREAQTRLPVRQVMDREWPAEYEGKRCKCHAGDWYSYPPRPGVQKLAERRWFTRIWVLQEVAAAKRVVVMCGDVIVDGDDVYNEMIMSSPWNRVFQKILPRARPALELMKRSTSDSKLGARPLIELIETFRTWEATRPVDKIYALLGLSSDASAIPDLQPNYTILPNVLAHKLVKFAFPTSVISSRKPDQSDVHFEIESLVLGTLGGSEINGVMLWSIEPQESSLSTANPNPMAIAPAGDLGRVTWNFLIAGERRLRRDSLVVLLRGGSLPTVVRFHGGKYIVDMLATPEPFKDGESLMIEYANSSPPELKNRGWNDALRALSAQPDGWTKFKFSWDPFRPLDSSEYHKYVPTPNSTDTQWDAILESYKDAAQQGEMDDHDCNTFSMLWGQLWLNKNEIERDTWLPAMTIHKAAYNGYCGALKILLDANADVDSRYGESCSTALHLAAEQGNTEVVRVLLKTGASVDFPNDLGQTPLWFAVNEGHAEISKMLLDAGASPSPWGSEHETLLFAALGSRSVDIVTSLLKAGANVDATVPFTGITSLHTAAEGGHTALVKVLLEAGAQVSSRTVTGATPLHQASVHGCTEVARLLLGAGADIDALDHDKMTPLDCAVYCGQLETMREIHQAGGRLNVVNTRSDVWKYVDVEDYVDEEQYDSEKAADIDDDKESDEEDSLSINRSRGGAEDIVANREEHEEADIRGKNTGGINEDVNNNEEISREEGVDPEEIDMDRRRLILQKMFSDKKHEVSNFMWPRIHNLMAQSRDAGADVEAQDDEWEDVKEGSDGDKEDTSDEGQYNSGEEDLDEGIAAKYINTNEERYEYRVDVCGEEGCSEEAEHVSCKESDKLKQVIYSQGWNSNNVDRHKKRLHKRFERMVLRFQPRWRNDDISKGDNVQELCNTDEGRDEDREIVGLRRSRQKKL
ncbi:MAG: hypothetical protein Q9201_005492 [Fulgogasparrea decipioides]